jgi:predicted AAA+ superfamily ATPase
MTDLLKELKTLNKTLQRLADFYLPSLAPDVFDSFKAFRAYSRNNNLCVSGIPYHDRIRLQELRGIDQAVSELKKNTEQFLNRLPCNNVFYTVQGGRENLLQ